MAIPSVTMHEVGVDVHGVEIRATPHRAESRTQRLRAGEITRVQFEADDLEIAFLEPLIAEATHFNGNRLGQLSGQIANVHARAAIDMRRILVSQEQDFHARVTSLERRLCQARNHRNGRLSPIPLHLFRAYEKYWDIDRMTHFVGSRAVQHVTDEAVPVCSHGDQVDIFLAGQLDDFIRRLAQRQHRAA